MARRRQLRSDRWDDVVRPDRYCQRAQHSQVSYSCPQGHVFAVSFASTAEPPRVWTCRQHGAENCQHIEETQQVNVRTKSKRTHLTMLLERRSLAELDGLLAETLAAIHRQGGARPGSIRFGDRTYSFRFPT